MKGVTPAGGRCAVKCKSPYNFNVSYLECPADNTKYRAPMLYEEPYCELECEVPDPMPAGYAKVVNGSYYCAPGYAGKISVTCVTDASCKPVLTLAGCYPKRPCKVPPALTIDPCKYETAHCSRWLAGEQCTFSCKKPYVGESVTITCPPRNIM